MDARGGFLRMVRHGSNEPREQRTPALEDDRDPIARARTGPHVSRGHTPTPLEKLQNELPW